MSTLGPLLNDVLGRIEEPEGHRGYLAVASAGMMLGAAVGAAAGALGDDLARLIPPLAPPELLPVTALLPRRRPEAGEPWAAYRDDTLSRAEKARKRLAKLGVEAEALVSAGALRFEADPEQLRHVGQKEPDFELVELDPLLEGTALDDVPEDIEYVPFITRHPTLDGTGVTVAVLDTGIDSHHPSLQVAAATTACAEGVDIPGRHGTHCAGIVSSRDPEFRGVAPGVSLVDVKVGRASGLLEPGELARGFDQAADAGADILSVSIGFNHRPRITPLGHGWTCSRRTPCLVCRAVDTAVRREAQFVVVAAGNEHERTASARQIGLSVDTELCCPGQASQAFTVASIAKGTWLPASTSSRGPSSSGAAKPDVAAPGVNITSTVPVPRDAGGNLRAQPSRSELFARDSGTSMATPIVAGMAALLAQRMAASGKAPSPRTLRRALLRSAKPLQFGPDAVGKGRAALI